jgi:N-acetylmuramoyl-L-alanine amidase
MKFPFVVAMLALSAVCFHCARVDPLPGQKDDVVGMWGLSPNGAPSQSVSSPTSSSGLLREVNLKVDMVKKGTYGRRVVRPMTPRYITIHSTQNYSADAERHSMALKRGALRSPIRPGGNRIGFLIWHFTVDDRRAIQHMPTTEQGEHADFDGPGNRFSIGIEMCEQKGSNLSVTIERTAKLTAYLMHQNGIPLSRVVPHYHWPRRGKNPPNKNCPHFLMDNGRPGAKWRWFLSRVDYHYKRAYQQSYVAR